MAAFLIIPSLLPSTGSGYTEGRDKSEVGKFSWNLCSKTWKRVKLETKLLQGVVKNSSFQLFTGTIVLGDRRLCGLGTRQWSTDDSWPSLGRS